MMANLRESRPLDHLYDPVFISKSGIRALYRTNNVKEAKAALEGTQRAIFCAQPNIRYTHNDTNIYYDAQYLKSPTMQSPQNGQNNQNNQNNAGANGSSSQMNSPQATTTEQQSNNNGKTTHTRTQSRKNILSYLDTSGQRSKTIGIQTDYRESECQTDPYTPQFVIKRENENGNENSENNGWNTNKNENENEMQPAILDLQHLSYSKGTLPVGYDEIEALEREKIKKEIIASLPNSNDAKSLQFRRRILTQLEKSDWEYRESLMKKEQSMRLNAIMETMKERDKINEEFEKEKLSKLQMQLYENHNKLKKKIQMKRIKALRKIGNKHKIIENIIDSTIGHTPETNNNNNNNNNNMNQENNLINKNATSNANGNGNRNRNDENEITKVEKKKFKKDLVSKYFDYASDVYVTKKINGKLQNKDETNKLIQMISQQTNTEENTKSHYYATKKLNQLTTNTMKNITSMKNIGIKTPHASRTQLHIMQQLDHIDNVLGATHDQIDQFKSPNNNKSNDKDNKKFENSYNKFNPSVRPPTPKFEAPINMTDQQSIAIVQSLIRGRATQNEMYQGMEKNIQLIKELQVNQDSSSPSAQMQEKKKEELRQRYRKQMLEKSEKDKVLANIYKQVTSEMNNK